MSGCCFFQAPLRLSILQDGGAVLSARSATLYMMSVGSCSSSRSVKGRSRFSSISWTAAPLRFIIEPTLVPCLVRRPPFLAGRFLRRRVEAVRFFCPLTRHRAPFSLKIMTSSTESFLREAVLGPLVIPAQPSIFLRGTLAASCRYVRG